MTPTTAAMNRLSRALLLPALLAAGLVACDDKQAQNNTPTKPSTAPGTSQSEPQTDQSAPATQRPKP